MSVATTIPLSDAKTHLSSIVHSVHDAGERYTITLRNKPIAMVIPVPTSSPEASATRGLLSKYANESAREHESTALAEAIGNKYVSAS